MSFLSPHNPILLLFILVLFGWNAYCAVAPWSPPLSTRGRWIVDSTGNRFKLKSGNWHGASGTWNGESDKNDDKNSHAGENSHNLPLGLQYVPIAQILDSFEALGINSIRLPFSNEMIHDTSTVLDYWVDANPQLKGMTPLQVYDAVVAELTARGFAVILNNHTNKARWCCGVNDGNERWNESQTAQKWADDWVFMVKRFANNPRVIGADLYNEVRRDILVDPNWGWGNEVDWYSASHWVGDRILTEANPEILVIVEGINWIGLPVDGLPHSRPTLEGAYFISHTLVKSNKLVYSAHFYAYTGPNHSGATGIGETSDPRYRDLSKDALYNVLGDSAAYVALHTDRHYVRPLWISEFGVEGRGVIGGNTRDWFDNFLQYLMAYDLDFAFWPLVGYLENGQGNGWGLMNWDRNTGHRDGLTDGNDWRQSRWTDLVNSGYTGPIENSTTWQMLSIDQGDYVQSLTMRPNDWDMGARKAACPDGLRLIGLSRSKGRGLCTDRKYGQDLWAPSREAVTVKDERYTNPKGFDWATTFTKLECPQDHYAIGYSFRGPGMSSVLCAKASRPLNVNNGGRTLWFDRSDNRADGDAGGEWALNAYKGQCSGDEYIAGVAFSKKRNEGSPAALLCRS